MTPAQRTATLAGFIELAEELLTRGRALVADGRDPIEAAAEVVASASPVALAATAGMSIANAIATTPVPTATSRRLD